MRPRTFLLLVLVLIAGAAVLLLVLFNRDSDSDLLSGIGLGQPSPTLPPLVQPEPEEPSLPPPTPTPALRLVPVVIARSELPVGVRLTDDLLDVELRPDTNIAIRAGYTFTGTEQLLGRIVGTEIGAGQAVLNAMLALSPTDVTAFGSDLALQLESGRVAVAFPINRFSGAAYAFRPGDRVDVLMSLTLADLDEEFQSALPNRQEQVDQIALLDGQQFLFPAASAGRLEVIPGINIVGLVSPGANRERFPRKVTQLTIQQAQVIWAGTWVEPRDIERAREAEIAAVQATARAIEASGDTTIPVPTLPPVKERPEDRPDVVILSLTPQDALVLKWALEVGINIDLALRAQGDNQVFITTSVSLPQALEQSGLTVPLKREIGLEPRIEDVPVPSLPPTNPNP